VNRKGVAAFAVVSFAASWFAAGAPSVPPRHQDVRIVAGHDRRVHDAVTAYFAGSAAPLFGGSYPDGAGRTVVLVTGHIDRVRADLAGVTHHGAPVLVRSARFPLARLVAIVDTLTLRVEALRADGALIASVSVDEEANRVVVGMEKVSSTARAVVLSAVARSDRSAIAFEVSGPNFLE